MSEQQNNFEQTLGELLKQIEGLPEKDRERLKTLGNETRERHARTRKSISKLQESLDYLRLSIKYLVFDLEATRRENKYLRDMIKRDGDNGGGRDEREGAD